MFNHIFLSLKGYKKSYLLQDFIAGIVVAALTIPVALGYAQIAGIPPIYGLYASFLPTIAYAVFASSPQLIFGIDATASAITGTILLYSGIAPFSSEAMMFVSKLSLFTGIFLILFGFAKVDKLVRYISIPVVSGTMTGIALMIMISQINRMIGATIIEEGALSFTKIWLYLQSIRFPSVILSSLSLVIILLTKKRLPKLPIAIIILVVATILSSFFHFEAYGISIVGVIPKGFPKLSFPKLLNQSDLLLSILGGLVTAIVGIAGSLLPSQDFANRNNYKIDNRRELFAFGIANLAGAISSVSPTSASVSRTAASEESKGKTQVVSLVAAGAISIVFLFLSNYLYYMPQPVLSTIVFTSLLNVLNLKKIVELFSYSRIEALVWLVSLTGVLVVGVLTGIILGVILSFLLLILDKVSPESSFLGVIEGQDGYYDLERNSNARKIEGVLIYRFSSSLTFANVHSFIEKLNENLDDTITLVVIDASLMTKIDTTALKQLSGLLESLDKKKIDWYFSNVIGSFRDRLTSDNTKDKISNELITKTIDEALRRYHSLKH